MSVVILLALVRALTEFVRGNRLEGREKHITTERRTIGRRLPEVVAKSDRECDKINGPVRLIIRSESVVKFRAGGYIVSRPMMISSRTYDRDGSCLRECEYARGIISTRTEFSGAHRGIDQFNVVGDDARRGRCGFARYDAAGILMLRGIYSAIQDTLAEIDYRDGRNRREGMMIIRYDSLDRIVESIARDRSDCVDSSTRFSYDVTGRPFEARDYRAHGFAHRGRRYFWNGDGRLLRVEFHRNVMSNYPDSLIRYRYDSAGNRTEECHYGISGSLAGKIIFQRDIHGHCVTSRIYASSDFTMPEEEWRHDYDRHENIIRSECFRREAHGGGAALVPVKIIYNEFAYF
ncbi:MAG: hypothetical protein ABIQ57_17890 [Candidatus Kapaibacterium sp.]